MEHNIITGNDFYHQWSGDKPVRIVSLVPSLTEAFYYFGLNEQIAGVTKFCELPHTKVPEPKMIGGTKNPNLKRIRDLNPDIIFASKEENNQEDVEALSEFCPVIVTDIKNIRDNIEFLKSTGKLFNKTTISKSLIAEIESLYGNKIPFEKKSAVYLIWKDPLMTIGGDTFIHDMMEYAGLDNLYKNKERYPELKEKELEEDAPAYILLSSEPYPFKETDVMEFSNKYPLSRVILVDGQMFSWYGVRPLYAKNYFIKLLSY